MRTSVILVALALLVAACGEEGTTATTEAAGATTTSGAAAMTEVHTADTEAGSVLVGPDGLTLYVFTADTNGESTCYDACADLWPPVPGDTEVSADLDASSFGTTTRTDGTEQLTVSGMPLYWYEPDDSPGDAKGQGFNGVWFVVDAEGSIVEASAAPSNATDDTAVDYDYDYGG